MQNASHTARIERILCARSEILYFLYRLVFRYENRYFRS